MGLLVVQPQIICKDVTMYPVGFDIVGALRNLSDMHLLNCCERSVLLSCKFSIHLLHVYICTLDLTLLYYIVISPSK